MAWLALIAEPHVSYTHLSAPLVIAGAGVSLATQSAVVSSVAPHFISKAGARSPQCANSAGYSA